MQYLKSRNNQKPMVSLEKYNTMKSYYEGQIEALKDIIRTQNSKPQMPILKEPRLSPYP